MREYIKNFITRLVTEGSRVFWTGVEWTAGVIGGFSVPIPDAWSQYVNVTTLRAFIGGVIALVATKLKELARKRLSSSSVYTGETPPRPDLR